MRLIAAELLKMRRRTATYVVLAVILILMVLTMGLVASDRELARLTLRFPVLWATAADYPFGALGSLLAISYAAAIAGADWNWGVLRNVIARGESRVAYVLAKAVAIAIVLSIGVAIVLVVGVLLGVVLVSLSGVSFGNPLSQASIEAFGGQVLFGLPVLLERAALGFAVAIVLRSQIAGVVVGIVVYIGEAILTTTLTFSHLAAWMGRFFPDERMPAQWFQYLPFAIGNEVRAAAAVSTDTLPTTDFMSMLLSRVPIWEALLVLSIYVALALVLSTYRAWREEIVA